MKTASLIKEKICADKNCSLCNEAQLSVGNRTDYGAVIVFKTGNADPENGWYATLSPKTGGDPEKDFTIMLMPNIHLTHFCQISNNQELAKNYGIAFSKISMAMTEVMALGMAEGDETEDKTLTNAETREKAVSVALYGKCTNWKDKKEHLHIKVFPFRSAIGQPYTVDSTFEKKEIFQDKEGEYVKMLPVRKKRIEEKRFEETAKRLIELLK